MTENSENSSESSLKKEQNENLDNESQELNEQHPSTVFRIVLHGITDPAEIPSQALNRLVDDPIFSVNAQCILSKSGDMKEETEIQYPGKIAEFQAIFRSLFSVYRITTQVYQMMKENPSFYGQAAPSSVKQYADLLGDMIRELNPEVKLKRFE